MNFPFNEYVFQMNSWRNRKARLLKSLCEKAGVIPFGFHAIRHLSASVLDQANVSIKTIQLILRHKNISTTSNYLHSLRGVKEDLNKALKVYQINGVVSKGGE